MSTWVRRATAVILAAAAVILIMLGLVFSPVALRGLAGLATKEDWLLLGNVGEAYGSTAMLLAALSLAGVALSAAFQARAVRSSVAQNERALHLELVRFILEEPSLLQVAGGSWSGPEDDQVARLRVFANLWLAHWFSHYELRQLSKRELREFASIHFQHEIARNHWTARRELYLAAAATRREMAFYRIVDDVYHDSLNTPASPMRLREGRTVSRPARLALRLLYGSATLAALTIAFLAGRRLR
ncbi:DUF6082 family protein [Nonomuraea sp. NPDC050547]|uniref:DUF6082 family protein n=1 Tax=Nonomuraea sp. NPDC050547 TaxID=3364368 RepID=UPI0037BBD6AA